MARTAEEIFNSMISEKQGFASLGGLLPIYNLSGLTPDNPFRKFLDQVSNASAVSVWLLTIWIVANAQHTLEVLWDNLTVELNQIAASSIVGTLPWYAAQVKAWQYGFGLTWNAATYRYYYTNTSSPNAIAARIVAKVSVIEVTNANFAGVLIKVAKFVGPDVLGELDTNEATALTAYIDRIKFAGVKTSIITLPPDLIRLHLNIYYDGVLDLPAFSASVSVAITNYLDNIPFSGVFYMQDFIDSIQLVPGIKDPVIDVVNISCKAASASAYTNVTQSYDPASGYFEMIPLGSDSFNNTVINFIAV